MIFDIATSDVPEHLTELADLHELREALRNLRAIAPDSVLAQLVEDKIERLQHEADDFCRAPSPFSAPSGIS
ncbi:MAG TPA: hypothetical protein VHL98_11360 [Microvirga sp.]|jgi:hypothetical protein|nr:hypothetical protein [Microvirga sp.]